MRGLRQHGREVGGEHGEGIDQFAAHLVQAFVLAFLFCQLPRFVGVDVFVNDVGQRHDFAQGFGVFAVFVVGGDGFGLCGQLLQQRAAGNIFQTAFEAFGDKTGGAGSDVDVFADQIAVDAGDEVVQVQIDVFDAAVEFGGDVVAHPFGVEAAVEIGAGGDEGAARFGHFLAVNG